jgi:rhamnogalacturonan endolyase
MKALRLILILPALSLVEGHAGCSSAPQPMAPAGDELFRDDFSKFPVGMLSAPLGQLNPAVQEYHWLEKRGVSLDPWENSIIYLDPWSAGEEDGRPYLEMHLSASNRYMESSLLSPCFVTGDPEWRDCSVEALVKPLSFDETAGLVFRYHTNRHQYIFVLEKGKQVRLAVRQMVERAFCRVAVKDLGIAEFPYDTKTWYRLRVENEGPKIRAFVDGKLVISAESDEIPSGKVGLIASCPARFADFRVSCTAKEEIAARIRKRAEEERALQAENPKPKLWKKFETPLFGAGRNVRFGDLDGDGVPEMVIAQVVSKVDTGNFVECSCLTAVTLDGKVLWQIGKPDPRHGLLTSDTPFQVHDIDGKGKCDVFLVKDFKLQILDGMTGKVKKWMWMPEVPEAYKEKNSKFELKERPHELNAGDSISFFDLSGKGRRTEILLKDRYRFFWTYDKDLKPLWQGGGRLGHFPYPWDVDGDGRDEVFIGYSMWTPDGKQLWSNDVMLNDHADGVAVGNFSGDPKGETRVYAVGSDEGFVVQDLKGNVLRHQRVGHTQNMTVAKLRPDLPGLQIATINFWKNPGILTVFDPEGNLLTQAEPHHCGSLILPVNWRGDGQEFLLLSGDVKQGGMLDGRLRRAVLFPDDGHPDLAAAVMDLTGDARDEILLWDQNRVWIYTQDRPCAGEKVYAPQRNPTYNESNYRAQVSLPRWK